MNRLKLLLLTTLFIVTYSCKQKKVVKPTGVVADKAMVVSARIEASKIGLAIMEKGGNAFDAMVATELALAVAYPYAGNIGGGGFMVYRKASGDIGAIDYREKAPLATHKDIYLDSLGNVIPKKSTVGATAVGVPGTIAGVFAVHKKFGTMPIAELIAPAIALAKKGIVVTKNQEIRLKKHSPAIINVNGDSIMYVKTYKAGDTIKYNAIANTLSKIAKNGRDEFYKGETAKKIAAFIQKGGGYITEEDLANYKAKWRTPVTFNYKNLNIISMSPPSSGGITLHQIFKMIAPLNVGKYKHNSIEAIQVITEAERRAYADRNYFLGDPDYVDIPLETITSGAYLAERMSSFSFDKATSSADVSHGNVEIIESDQTTHYSIIDQFGNAVSATTTLNAGYGSKLYNKELGFFFNNEMDDFSAKPGIPNMFGLIGAEANSIAPGKRMLSSMTPTIVEKNGKLSMVLGSPGGSTIITSVLQTILNVYEYDLSMQDAVNAPRFHHQWLPDVVMFEPDAFDKKILTTLEGKGYSINEGKSVVIGKVDAILKLPNGKLEGGADRRGDDAAVGY